MNYTNYVSHEMIMLIIVVIGLVMGSFISLASYRVPRNIQIITQGSHCPICNHELGLLDLIPLLSWVCSKGKCRHCHAPISIRYPIIELSSSAISGFIYYKYGLNAISLIYIFTALCAIMVIVTDLEHYIIPDGVQITLMIFALLLAFIAHSSLSEILIGSLIGIGTGFGLRYAFMAIRKQDALGIGDIKFMGIAGLYLGTAPLAVFYFMAGAIGIITALLWRRLGKGEVFPFGPALAVSMMLCLLWPELGHNISDSVMQLSSIYFTQIYHN